MSNHSSRRTFIKTTGKAGVAAGIALTVLPSWASADNEITPTGFTQKPLPYEYKALEPVIDTMTMEIHYSKHAAAYAKNLADACAAENVNLFSARLEDVLRNISKYSAKMRNNGGGHYNHELFWQCMGPGGVGGKPAGKLAATIDQSFGSYDTFKTQFSDAGKNRFGSGWAWLVLTDDKKLVVSSTPNQDNPLMDIAEVKGTPLLGLDVWEHAYYLKYQNKRPDYVNNWWNVVNWNYVQRRFEQA
ncbi:MAG: superoxide dismutase [Sediminibacterium sp.]|nr:superoxide dismutase [Sediminibacterium sp.]